MQLQIKIKSNISSLKNQENIGRGIVQSSTVHHYCHWYFNLVFITDVGVGAYQ